MVLFVSQMRVCTSKCANEQISIICKYYEHKNSLFWLSDRTAKWKIKMFEASLFIGAVQRKLTFLADMSVQGVGGQNPCPLRKCKFLWMGEKCQFYEENNIWIHDKKN